MSNKTKVNIKYVRVRDKNRCLSVSVDFFEDIDRMNEQWKLFEDSFGTRCKLDSLDYVRFPHCGLGLQSRGRGKRRGKRKQRPDRYMLIRKPIICDYMVFYDGITAFIDCKYTESKVLKYSTFYNTSTRTQYHNFIDKLHRQRNVLSGFVFGMPALKSCYFVDSRELYETLGSRMDFRPPVHEVIDPKLLIKIGSFKNYNPYMIFNCL